MLNLPLMQTQTMQDVEQSDTRITQILKAYMDLYIYKLRKIYKPGHYFKICFDSLDEFFKKMCKFEKRINASEKEMARIEKLKPIPIDTLTGPNGYFTHSRNRVVVPDDEWKKSVIEILNDKNATETSLILFIIALNNIDVVYYPCYFAKEHTSVENTIWEQSHKNANENFIKLSKELHDTLNCTSEEAALEMVEKTAEKYSETIFNPARCSMCGKKTTQTCSVCRIFYCSKECQLKDYDEHKKICKHLALMLRFVQVCEQ